MADAEFTALLDTLSGDRTTAVAQLRRVVDRFVADRNWQVYHAPKNLAMALAIEAAELMEHFQWCGVDESRDFDGREEQRAEVAAELADVICYAFAIANALDLDVSQSVAKKMRRNVDKYPAGNPDPTRWQSREA